MLDTDTKRRIDTARCGQGRGRGPAGDLKRVGVISPHNSLPPERQQNFNMPTAALNSKGQITIPQAVRAALGLQAGTKLDFVVDEDGFKVVPLLQTATTLKGRFAGRVAHAVSMAAMDEAIASEVASRHRAITTS